MNKRGIALLVFLAVVALPAPAYPSSSRTLQADSIKSADLSKTYSLPAASGTVMLSAGLVQEQPSGSVNGSNTSFSLANTPVATASVTLYLDGLALAQGGGQDYTISGATITMATAPAAGQKLWAVYSKY